MLNKTSRQLINKLLLGFFLLCPMITNAVPSSEKELAMLPPYCKARIKGGADEAFWKAKFGPSGWGHLHHYCSGLNQINKANLATSTEKRNEYLQGAINGFEYQLKHGKPDFILLPELHTLRGDSYFRLGDPSSAITEYNKAIKVNPKYTKSYIGLSKVFANMGKNKQASDIIKQGLKQKPNSRSLKRQLKKVEAKN